MVLARCLIAIISGFLIANLSIALLAFSLPMAFARATFLGFLLSFVIWLVFVIYVFSAKSLLRIFIWSSLIMIMQFILITVFKSWSLS